MNSGAGRSFLSVKLALQVARNGVEHGNGVGEVLAVDAERGKSADDFGALPRYFVEAVALGFDQGVAMEMAQQRAEHDAVGDVERPRLECAFGFVEYLRFKGLHPADEVVKPRHPESPLLSFGGKGSMGVAS